jgi:hypothetical protein
MNAAYKRGFVSDFTASGVDQLKPFVCVVPQSEKFAGCLIQLPPRHRGRALRGTKLLVWQTSIMLRNHAEYFGLSSRAYLRRVFVEFGSHYFHCRGAAADGGDPSIEEMESRIGYIHLKFSKSRENRDYRAAVDSLSARYGLPPWRIYIHASSEKRLFQLPKYLGVGDIVLCPAPGQFRN